MNNIESNKKGEGIVSKLAGYALRYLLPLALTVALLCWMFKKVNFSEMMNLIRHGVDYWWILLAMFISIFSHIIRAKRWQLQLDALDIRPPFQALCCSIFGCYALNLVFPRLGEVWRCTYISKKGKAPFTTVVGSMVADRLSDSIAVGVLIILTFFVASGAINTFLLKYPVGRGIIDLLMNPVLWIGVVAFCLMVWGLIFAFRKTNAVRKLWAWIKELWEGFAVVLKMPGRGKFLFLTVCIWSCYFVQLYVAFYAFSFTRDLCVAQYGWGLVPCLVAFVLSSIGMGIPSNGGLGPWNIAIMFGLAIYGVSDAQGTAFSMLQWSGQAVMLIILGLYTLGYIMLTGTGAKRRK